MRELLKKTKENEDLWLELVRSLILFLNERFMCFKTS